ncbi:hypothetical protein FRB95_008572 [Tulasnella sp. JGI-2019a]|nr:hypothetical protein FRB95_008572 [Tulasnella sp. JGI-2019a]
MAEFVYVHEGDGKGPFTVQLAVGPLGVARMVEEGQTAVPSLRMLFAGSSRKELYPLSRSRRMAKRLRALECFIGCYMRNPCFCWCYCQPKLADRANLAEAQPAADTTCVNRNQPQRCQLTVR